MQRERNLRGLADEIAGELLRVIVHPQMKVADLIGAPLVNKYVDEARPVNVLVEAKIESRVESFCHFDLIKPALSIALHRPEIRKCQLCFNLKITNQKLELNGISPPVSVPRIESVPSRVQNLNCKIDGADRKVCRWQPLRAVDRIASYEWSCASVRHFRDFINLVRIHRKPKVIYQYPVLIEPVPWRKLRRETILACWELLKGQALEEYGYDPGRDLEMLAVFPLINISCFERIGFDPVERKMIAYPRPLEERLKHCSNRCVIIIGTVRGTRRLLQAALKVNPDLSC